MALYSVRDPWNPADELAFIKAWRPYYQRKKHCHASRLGGRKIGDGPYEEGWFPPSLPAHIKDHIIIQRLYRLATARDIIRMDYQQFADLIHYDTYIPSNCPCKGPGESWKSFRRRLLRYDRLRRRERRSDQYDDYYPRNGAHFRQKVPLGITEPKNISEDEQSRRDWREKKGFRRDKSRRHSRSWKKWAKHFSNSEWRHHEKQFLEQEQWDELPTKLPKDWFDPWRWD